MEKSLDLIIKALKPLGTPIMKGGQPTFNCPRCEKELGNPIDKYNLEVNIDKEICHCWACGKKGTLYSLIKNYGYTEFLSILKKRNGQFKEEKKKVSDLSIFYSKLKLGTVFSFHSVYSYLLYRGLTKETISEREILFCYEGDYKNYIVFPSYNNEGVLTALNFNHLITKKYKKLLGSSFICFYENFINKNTKIVLTEGVYDALVVPNAIPLLGTEISEELLVYLTNTDVILILDSDVNERILEQKTKQLNSVCNSIEVLLIEKKHEDLNKFFILNKNLLKKRLKEFYK